MVNLEDIAHLLDGPSEAPDGPLNRAESFYKPLHTFTLDKARSYKQQYGDMYFLRLTKIKPAVEEVASKAWESTVIGDEKAERVDRVLDVRQGMLCWVAGTVYMDMRLKPNILEDVSKDLWLSKRGSAKQRYYSDDDSDQTMLEDDSGRIRLVGELLKHVPLVTGCIIAVMGTENTSGEFEVIDLKVPDLPPQPERWALSKPASTNDKTKGEDVEMSDSVTPGPGKQVAIVSGLSFSGTDASYELELNLLLEFLLGEPLGPDAQANISQISRLIIAGNSVSTATAKPSKNNDNDDDDDDDGDDEEDIDLSDKKANKKYGYDASSYNPIPSQLFDEFLAQLLPTIPVTLLPGMQDPANASYPQQPIHTAMFPLSRVYSADLAPGKSPQQQQPGWFDAVTNPFEGEIEGWRVLGTGGQNVDDVFKYVDSEDRLGMMEAMCRWRCCAPTAPDTLWSYPFQDDDPFVLQSCPHLYFVGCQPEFGTKVIQGPNGQSVRLIAVPSFAKSKEIVLVDTETLEVSKIRISTGPT